VADSPLQKVPAGLLDALSLRTLGQNPTLFGELVRPTVELLDMYLADRTVTTTSVDAAGAITGVFQAAASVNPRRLLGVTARVTLGAAPGTALTINTRIRTPTGAALPAVLASRTIGGAPPLIAAFTYQSPWIPGAPVIVPAGHVLECATEGDAAGVDHVRGISFVFQHLGVGPF
jgi:hypothetical protein